jgi:hypothetical protein
MKLSPHFLTKWHKKDSIKNDRLLKYNYPCSILLDFPISIISCQNLSNHRTVTEFKTMVIFQIESSLVLGTRIEFDANSSTRFFAHSLSFIYCKRDTKQIDKQEFKQTFYRNSRIFFSSKTWYYPSDNYWLCISFSILSSNIWIFIQLNSNN